MYSGYVLMYSLHMDWSEVFGAFYCLNFADYGLYDYREYKY